MAMKTTTTPAITMALLSTVADATRMTTTEREAIEASPVARLIAELPFIAGCSDAKRTALAHLAIYVIAQRGQAREVFDHAVEDNGNIMSRLRLGMNFQGGNKEVIDAGMARLALVMVHGYLRDIAKDHATGEYNPVLWGQWDAQAVIADLEAVAGFGIHPELDEVLGMDASADVFWN